MVEFSYFIFVFCFLIWLTVKLPFFKISELNKWLIPSSFVIKVFIGFFVSYYFLNIGFKHKEPSDTYRFFEEGKELQNVYYKSKSDYFSLLFNIGDQRALAFKHFKNPFLWNGKGFKIINDTRNLIRLNSILNFISFQNILIHITIYCFISFIGLLLLIKSVISISNVKPIFIYFTLYLYPSLLFWSSSILKEPFIILGLGLLLYSFFKINNSFKKFEYSVIALSVLILFKPYIAICIAPIILFLALYYYFLKERFLFSILTLIFLIFIPFIFIKKNRILLVKNLTTKQIQNKHLGLGGLHLKTDTCFYYFKPNQFSSLEVNTADSTAQLIKPILAIYHSKLNKYPSKTIYLIPNGEKWKVKLFTKGANTFFETNPINFQAKNLIRNIPEALFNSYFRPLPNEKGGILKFIAIIETLLLTLFLCFSIIYRHKISKEQKVILFCIFCFSVLILLLVGWTSCVSGEIVRYRLPAQMGIIIFSLILIKVKK